ncbi:MAG: dihydrolipoamide acetyltransferase family protein [Thermoguttaceae bacterium]|jgi:pyruvate dehydrogenase E2 component (dihydrolipoamide acetyltransferase)
MNIDFQLPELGENIHSGDIVSVLVHEGDRIAANDGVVELETDKAVVEIPCPHGGRVAKLLVKKGDTVQVGQPLLTVEVEEQAAVAQPSAKPQTVPQPSAKPQAAPQTASQVPAGPAARRLARELGVDLAAVRGSGRGGRITPEDVQAVATAQPPAAAEPQAAPGQPGQDAWGPVRRERISRIRRTIAEQMARSAAAIPHVTNFDDADVTDLERIRQGVPPGTLGPNVKLTLLALVMRGVAACLRRHPVLNASFDEANQEIVYKEYVNLGIAVDTPRGLVVPSVRNADRLTVAGLAQALATIAQRARGGQFGVEDLRGGTFTLSNMGAVGGLYSTPIINHPEVAILLLGRARWLPAVRGPGHDRIEPRLMLPLSLSYDHRLVDGAVAARFLNDVIQMLENPGALLIP